MWCRIVWSTPSPSVSEQLSMYDSSPPKVDTLKQEWINHIELTTDDTRAIIGLSCTSRTPVFSPGRFQVMRPLSVLDSDCGDLPLAHTHSLSLTPTLTRLHKDSGDDGSRGLVRWGTDSGLSRSSWRRKKESESESVRRRSPIDGGFNNLSITLCVFDIIWYYTISSYPL